MNDAHWHLAVNHFPIIFPMIGVIILLTGLFLKSEIVQRVAYGVIILGSLSTFAAMYTGEPAEHIIKKMHIVDKHIIHEHEEVAETFALLNYGLGALSLLGLWGSWKKKPFAQKLPFVILLFSMVVLYFGKATGNSGGEIRHTEIRSDFNLDSLEAVK